jgi:hypothetical protein
VNALAEQSVKAGQILGVNELPERVSGLAPQCEAIPKILFVFGNMQREAWEIMAARTSSIKKSSEPSKEKARHGGARPGAGRPEGAKDKKEVERSERMREQTELIFTAAKSRGEITDELIMEMSPLDVLLFVMRISMKVMNLSVAREAAAQAAPYIHPRLSATKIEGDPDNPIQHEHHVIEEKRYLELTRQTLDDY